MKQTSRHWLIDWVQMIGSCVAMCSHLQEVVNSYWTNPDITLEDVEMCVDQVKSYVKIRRDLMDMIRKEYDWDMHYWCALKHSIEAWQYATEILYANPDDIELVSMQQKASDNMYTILSRFIKQDITTCGRCLNETLSDIKPLEQ